MQKQLKQLIAESRILKSFLIFLLSYAVMLILWMQVKDVYRYGITVIASKFVAGVKDAKLEEVATEGPIINVYFSSLKVWHVMVGGKVAIASGAFNVPLTLSLLLSLSMFIRRKKRAFMEAIILFVLFDLLLVFFFETSQLTIGFVSKGVEEARPNLLNVCEFFSNVMNFASTSFEPFLIATYIYVRFRT